MSAIAPARLPTRAATRPATQPPTREAGARTTTALRLVAAPRAAAARLPFALLVAAILGTGLVALLMLHTLAAQDGFTVHKLQRQSAALADLEQQLTVADQQAQAPSALAARARALGMVPTGDLRIVRRRDGRIVAVADAMSIPKPAPKPSATASASASAKQSATTGKSTPTAKATPKPTTSAHPKPRAPH